MLPLPPRREHVDVSENDEVGVSGTSYWLHRNFRLQLQPDGHIDLLDGGCR